MPLLPGTTSPVQADIPISWARAMKGYGETGMAHYLFIPHSEVLHNPTWNCLPMIQKLF